MQAIKNGCPVVLVLDSKGCAQAVGEFALQLLRRGIIRKQRSGGAGESGNDHDKSEDDDGASALSEAAWVADLAARMKRRCSNQGVPMEKVRELVSLLSKRSAEGMRTLEQLLHVFSLQDQRMHTLQTSILNAVVSSCKLRSDRNARARATAKATHKVERKVGSLEQPTLPPVHHKARDVAKYSSMPRQPLTDETVPWSEPLPGYVPPFYEDPILNARRVDLQPGLPTQWADPPAPLTDEWRKRVRARMTFELGGTMRFDEAAGLPLNPRGRTGLAGRGLLGKWGPNHAADPIVTRLHPQTNQLQMVAVERQDEKGVWAIPGGFVDAGEAVSKTLLREFVEEVGDFDADAEGLQQAFNKAIHDLFQGGVVVYRGYVDDPRTTDNAWIETTACHFHCLPEVGDRLHLSAGDGARRVSWIDINPASEPRYANLYASHREWVDRVAEMFAPHERARSPYAFGRYLPRVQLSDEEVPWSAPLASYAPYEYTAPSVLSNMRVDALSAARFADAPLPDITGGMGLGGEEAVSMSLAQRITFEGAISFESATGRPLNPRGRTGLAGRGVLGKWGPNHAVDPIVTRVHPRTNKLQVVVARRPDTNEWALPGKFVERGESPAAALRVAFEHKASNFKGQDGELRMRQLLDELFVSQNIHDLTVYRGYVDDVRNT